MMMMLMISRNMEEDVSGGDVGEVGVAVVHYTNDAALSDSFKGGLAGKSHPGKGVLDKYSATGKVAGRKWDVPGDGIVEESSVSGKVCGKKDIHLDDGVVDKSSVCRKVHPGEVVVEKSAVAGMDKNSATGKVAGSNRSRDFPSISPGGLANPNDPKVRNFFVCIISNNVSDVTTFPRSFGWWRYRKGRKS